MISKKEIQKLEGVLYLHALSKSNSKREVADKLGISVDTLNKYISDLESELKTIFFTSIGRGTTVTPEGERLLKMSEQIIKLVKSLSIFEDMANNCKGTVRLSMPDTIACYLGTANMVDFYRQFPDINVETQIQNKLPDMYNLEADIALSFEPPWEEDLVLVAAKDVPCALYASESYIEKYGMPKDYNDLVENHRICNKDDSEYYIPGWRDVLEAAPHVVCRNNSVFSFRAAVENGIGIGVCFKYFGETNLVKIKTIHNFDTHFKIFLVAHKDTKDVPRIRAMLEYLKNLFQNIHEDY